MTEDMERISNTVSHVTLQEQGNQLKSKSVSSAVIQEMKCFKTKSCLNENDSQNNYLETCLGKMVVTIGIGLNRMAYQLI